MPNLSLPRLVLVKRDPFSRQEVTKERVYDTHDTCSWCGQQNLTPKTKRPYLFRFWRVEDSGRRERINGLFCSNDCRAIFHSS